MDHMKLNETSSIKRRCVIWQKRTLMERYLIIVCFLLFIVFLVLIGLLVHLENIYKKSRKETTCHSNVCKEEGGRILRNMDFSIDPCEDFYQFSCGSFMKYENVFSNEIDCFSNLEDYSLQLIKKVIEKPNEEGEPGFYENVRTYYHSCLNKSTGTKQVVADVLDKTGLKLWPVPENTIPPLLVEEVIARRTAYGDFSCLLGIYSIFNETSLQYIRIFTGKTILKESHLLNTTEEKSVQLKDQYKSLMKYVFLTIDLSVDGIQEETEKLLEFETELANITIQEWTDNETSTTVGELQSTTACEKIKWTTFMKSLYDIFGHANDYDDDIPLKINSMEYMKALCQLIDRSDLRTVHNYIIWNILLKYLILYDNYLMSVLNTESYSLSVPTNVESELKWKYCIVDLKLSVVRYGLDNMVIKRFPSDEVVKEVKGYVDDIKNTMEGIILKADWIDLMSKDILLTKLNNTAVHIGYSDVILDDDIISNIFTKFKLTDNYLENKITSEKTRVAALLFNDSITHMLREMKIDRPLNPNAFHFDGKNLTADAVVTLALLFPPFFTLGAPKYINYAGVAFVIAHEISHGFDSLERNFKEDNDTEETIDLSEDFKQTFRNKMNCIIDQYSKFPLDGNETVNGNQTIRDNIADNSGLIQAYFAYEKHIKNKEEPKLPGLDFTNKQMFFIKFAQLWCEIVDSPKATYENDDHSPGKYRALVPLMNLPEFSESFNCPPDIFMNPTEKCQIWG